MTLELGGVVIPGADLRVPVGSAGWDTAVDLTLQLGSSRLRLPLDPATRCALDPESCAPGLAPPPRIDLRLELPSVDVEVAVPPVP